jgi:proton glutamate symport protein
MFKKIPLHSKIILGLLFGIIFGIIAIQFVWLINFTIDFVKPVGEIFLRSLQLIAVPIVLASLIVGVSNLGNISKISRIGGKTIGIYMVTTTTAIIIGLLAVNTIKPGRMLPIEVRDELMAKYSNLAESSAQRADQMVDAGPLQPLVEMVPKNIFSAASDNINLLQVVLFALIFGIALLKVPKEKSKPVIAFFDGLNDVIINIIGFIMQIAPYGVFALIASLIVDLAKDDTERIYDILLAELGYSATVLLGLGIMLLVIYPLLFKLFTRVSYLDFFRGIRPAQLLAFSTSSSSATLPVTMKQVEEELQVSEEISSFVLPLGATINMDGTSLYQSVAAVFIAQALGMELSLGDQLMIILTAVLASIGSAGVPGAGMVMLVIVLEAIGIPAAGLALIVAPDRILDMCRTVVNITGDAAVAMVVASTEGELPEGLIKKPMANII